MPVVAIEVLDFIYNLNLRLRFAEERLSLTESVVVYPVGLT